jgi:hypothetical protein
MGFDVQAVVTFSTNPSAHFLDELDHQFGVVVHEPGSKSVTVLEHVTVNDAADATAFVRTLLSDAVPPGSKITEITATEV